MKTFEGITPHRLNEILAHFARLRIAVLGDFFLDRYLDIDPQLEEISLETNRPAHQVIDIHHSPGAAGTVVCNLASLGMGTIRAIGFTGDDGSSYELRRDLAAIGCDAEHLHIAEDRRTPTYLKPRDCTQPGLEGEYSRYDTKNRVPTSPNLERQLIDSLDTVLPNIDAVIVMDQVEQLDCGVVTGHVRDVLGERAKRFPHVIFWADSRRHIRAFRNMIVKPNQFEVVGIENPLPEDEVPLDRLESALSALRTELDSPIVVTRAGQGGIVADPSITLVPALQAESPIDPTGAGDSFTAGAVAALASKATLCEAALVGNLVASITIRQLATTGTARPKQLRGQLEKWHSQPPHQHRIHHGDSTHE